MTFKYPLLEDAFSNEDLNSAIKVIKSKKLTMSKKTKEFEKKFSNFFNTKFTLMLNSGSSANLLAFFALINPLKKNNLKAGDECLIPALCWSTSLWPIVQAGLKPKFIDVDLKTFSPSLEIIKKNITKRTKAIMLINVLGNCSELDKIKKFTKKKNIYLIEDNCESLGSIYKKKYLGTFGDFSTFSFYYSHQLTAGEGGMIVCNNKADYMILKSLRAHGWDREVSNKKNTFNFINQGFNLRPLEVSAAIALSQLKRLKKMVQIRKYNRDKIVKSLKNSSKWANQFSFFESSRYLRPSWFSIPLLINKNFLKNKKTYLKKLEKYKIETRPIISGNFINQPSVKLYKLKFNKKKFKNSQEIEDRGFFIGLPTKKIKSKDLKRLTDCLLDI
jgi:CDP-4-dehydro-6-deoxyglucose reductase, E1